MTKILSFFNNKIAFVFFFTLFLMVFSRIIITFSLDSHNFPEKSYQKTSLSLEKPQE